ncbi:MAG: hypothetical protein JW987_04765 [Anaerolineaceae bacterium]|nr:hypothetical protein [Anaerolineaceae bacterium]
MTDKPPSTCPRCTAVLSGEPSVCPYCGQELSKSEASVVAQPFDPPAPVAPVPPAKPVDQVPEWLADDAEELAAKYGVKEEAKKQSDAKVAEAGKEATAAAVQAAQASQVVTGKYKKSLGWGCLGGCVSYVLFTVMCLFSAFVIEEVAFPGQWESLESPFGVLAWIIPGLIGLAVLALITYLGRKKS